jgi:hypothetical protein
MQMSLSRFFNQDLFKRVSLSAFLQVENGRIEAKEKVLWCKLVVECTRLGWLLTSIKYVRGRIGGRCRLWLMRGAERVKKILGGEKGSGQVSMGKIGGRGV